jgi:hypothetical protein
VDTLIWFCWLQQRWQQCWGMQIIFLSHLATVAGLDVVGNVSIHTRPVVALKKALFCFIHALLTNFHETRFNVLNNNGQPEARSSPGVKNPDHSS